MSNKIEEPIILDKASVALLKQIESGIIIFEPLYRTSRELTDFQETVRRLLALEKGGLIGRCYTQEHEIAGTKFYDYIMIYTGLTAKGEELLAATDD